MLEVHRSPLAKADLISIWSFIAADNVRAADGLLDKVAAAISMLAQHPDAGRSRSELGDGLRSFPLGNHVVFYVHDSRRLTVVRVLSRYMEIEEAHFLNNSKP